MSAPVVESVTTSQFSGNSTTLVLNMPATVVAGEVLVIVFATDGNSDLTMPAGWERHRSSANGTAVRITIFSKLAVGDEGGTTVNVTVSAAQDGAAHVLRVSNCAGLPTAENLTATTSTAVNPPATDPNWGTRDCLFIVAIAADTDTGVSSYSTGYTNNQTATASGAGDANGATCITATRTSINHAGAEDPDNTTLTDSVAFVVVTIALRGAVDSDELGFARFYNQTGSKVTTPDAAALDILGDIDIRALVLIDELGGHPTRNQQILSKGDAFTANGSYLLRQPAGQTFFGLTWRESGGTTRSQSASAGAIPARGKYIWIRAVLDVDNGAGQYAVSFYTSTEAPTTNEDSVTWSLVNTVTGATGVTNIQATDADLWLGNRTDNPDERLSGDIMYAEIRNGIGGTKVAAVDFRDRDQRISDTLLNDGFRDWTVASPAKWFVPASAAPTHEREVGGLKTGTLT